MEESQEVEVVKLPRLVYKALATGFGRFEYVESEKSKSEVVAAGNGQGADAEEDVEEELKDSTIADGNGNGNGNDDDDKEGKERETPRMETSEEWLYKMATFHPLKFC